MAQEAMSVDGWERVNSQLDWKSSKIATNSIQLYQFDIQTNPPVTTTVETQEAAPNDNKGGNVSRKFQN